MTIRKRYWRTLSVPSSSDGFESVTGSGLVGFLLNNPTVLRTRAGCQETHTAATLPPAYLGNSFSPRALQVMITTEAAPPPDLWWEGFSGYEPVIFHPLVWGGPVYVPANATGSRPEAVHTMSSLAGGVADSQGMRHYDGVASILASYWVGPAIGVQSAADPKFSASLWIRCLVESDYPDPPVSDG